VPTLNEGGQCQLWFDAVGVISPKCFFNLRVVFLIVKFVLHSEIATYVGDNKFILSVFFTFSYTV